MDETRPKGDTKMTDDPPDLPRYLVRAGHHGRMVWDRQTRGPAKIAGRVIIGLTEERALRLRDELTQHHIAAERKKGIRQMLDPAPELPDDMPIEDVRFSTRIKNALNAAGIRTVGEVREASDKTLLSLQDFGQRSVDLLRDSLGLLSTGPGVKAKG
jgi:hypothetical protein